MNAQEQVKARWNHEAAFFDAATSQQNIAPINPLVVQRYSSASLRRRLREEFRFCVLNDLVGKRVLDIGCGDGRNSILLAKLGASVTGIDISPRSIEIARHKAAVNEVSDAANFICSPLEEAVMQSGSYDVIWGDCVLHHLIASLEFVMRQLSLWAKPGAIMLFTEPINFNNALRKLRLKVPVKTDATPDERPLEPNEIAVVRSFLPDLHMRSYSLLGRLNRFVLFEQHNYEQSSLPRRALYNAMAAFDYAALSLPGIRNLGSYAVLYGHAVAAESARLKPY